MSDTSSPSQATKATGITSLDNSSTAEHSSTAPVVVGASIAAVVVVVGLIFAVFYLFRRRAIRQNRYTIPADLNLPAVSKLDYLPREPSPPPPPYKDTGGRQSPAGVQPPVPPKDFGQLFIKGQRSAGAELSDVDIEAAREARNSIPFPKRTHSSNDHGMMF